MKNKSLLFAIVSSVTFFILNSLEAVTIPAGPNAKIEGVRSLIVDNLKDTEFRDLTITEIYKPWLSDKFKFDAVDASGNSFSGSIRVTFKVIKEEDLRTGKTKSESLECKLLGDGSGDVVFDLRNINGTELVSKGCLKIDWLGYGY